MPTYDYQCDACGHRFEKFQSITARPVRKCPQCGKNRVRRLIGTGAGVIFKGSGFYITDYKRKEEQAQAGQGGAERGEVAEKASPDGPGGAPEKAKDAWRRAVEEYRKDDKNDEAEKVDKKLNE